MQIEDYEHERNPYMHTAEDTIAHMNLDYWEEQIKATVAIAAHLAVPFTDTYRAYLPLVVEPMAARSEGPAKCDDQH